MKTRNGLAKAHQLTALGMTMLIPLVVDAATLGRMNVLSGPNEPLRAEIQLVQVDPREAATLAAQVGSRDAHERARIPFPDEAAKIDAAIARKPDGGYVIVLRSREAIREPLIDVLIELKSSLSEVARPYLIDTSLDLKSAGPADGARQNAAGQESLLQREMQARGDTPAGSSATPLASAAPVASPSPATPVASPTPATSVAAGATATTPSASPRAEPVSAARSTANAAKSSGAARIANAGDASASAGDVAAVSSVVVNKGDTLGSIAARVKAEEVTLDRAMLAIFRANQQAFFGSVHQLKSDLTLRIPSRESMLAEPDAFVARELRRHSEIFRNYKARVAGSVPLASSQASPPGKDGAVAGAEKYDRLVLSKGGASGTLSAQERRAATEVALREAGSRASDLQRNITDLNRLIELKDKQLAELTGQLKSLGGANAQVTAGGVRPVVSTTVAAAAAAAAASTSTAAAPDTASPPADSGQAASTTNSAAGGAASAVASTTKDAATPAARPAGDAAPASVSLKRVDPPASVRSGTESLFSSPWLYGALAVLVLLIAFMIRRSRQRKAAQAALDDDPHSLFGDTEEPDSKIGDPPTISRKPDAREKPQVVGAA